MKLTKAKIASFQRLVWDFYKDNKRDLPWRKTSDPYKILVSEVMLQQTQVNRVIQKYKDFISRFPNFKILSEAPFSEVLRVWQGMGYNRRALYLHRAALVIMREQKKILPHNQEMLVKLPGIGVNTAGAICAFAFNQPVVFIETNIRSVYIHEFFKDKDAISDKDVLVLIDKTLDHANPRDWYYALMDYGAYLKKGFKNPARRSLHYATQSKFEGSDRQIRGSILRAFTESQSLTIRKLLNRFAKKEEIRVQKILNDLNCEGFIKIEEDVIRLS